MYLLIIIIIYLLLILLLLFMYFLLLLLVLVHVRQRVRRQPNKKIRAESARSHEDTIHENLLSVTTGISSWLGHTKKIIK